MKIKDYKCKCGHNDFFFADKGSQKGIYCSYCGKWLKWADKDEHNLAMKQEPILDKIKAEIMSLDYIDEDKYEGTNIPPMIDRDNVLDILDKYKGESEDT